MKKHLAIVVAACMTMAACTTSTYVKLPPGSVLKIQRGDERPIEEGRVVRTPLSWSSSAGIPYKVEKDGAVIQEGKLRSRFRPASIFWPPFALFYWPMGFRQSCYDLTGGAAAECSPDTLRELRTGEKPAGAK